MMTNLTNLTNFRFPAEWEPHDATWLSWPHQEGISFPDAYQKVIPTFVQMVRALASSEKVCINVRDLKEQTLVSSYFNGDLPSKVYFFHIPTNEPWCRDHGPMFLINPQKKFILDWGYNAWGGKYPPFDLDDDVPTKIAKILQIESKKIPMILEGGSIDGNGDGVLLTTESCLLNPNRNPTLNKTEIENYLKSYLGIKQILWLGDGITGDDTDGHVDDLTRFVSRDTVVTVTQEDKKDANYHALEENLNRLRTMTLYDGTPLKVVTLPMPNTIIKEDTILPASYANFYIANKVVLLPIFSDPHDQIAIDILSSLFPTRQVIPINSRELIWGLGSFHCLTQQEPSIMNTCEKK